MVESGAFDNLLPTQPFRSPGLTAITDANIHAAVDAWVMEPAAAEATYGHIKWWDTGAVADMSYLFCGDSDDFTSLCTAAAQKATFDEDLTHW